MNNSIHNYIEISVTVLKKMDSELLFDLYIQRTKNAFSKIFKEGDTIDWSRFEQYVQKGIKFFCVTKEQYDRYLIYVDRLSEQLAVDASSFTAEETITLLKEMVNYSMHEIMVNLKIDEKVIANSSNIVGNCVDNLIVDRKGFLKIIQLMSSQPYIFKHSITVMIFSILLAQTSGYDSPVSLKHIGMGSFLHDIGISQIGFDPEDFEVLSADQRKQVCRHPELGKRQLDSLKSVRSEIVNIVLQHHEQPNGRGYPNNLKDAEIYPPAKLVSIADTFSSLIAKRPFRRAFTVDEAISAMKSDIGKYDKHILKSFIQMLRPES